MTDYSPTWCPRCKQVLPNEMFKWVDNQGELRRGVFCGQCCREVCFPLEAVALMMRMQEVQPQKQVEAVMAVVDDVWRKE